MGARGTPTACLLLLLAFAPAVRADWNQPATGALNTFPNGTPTSGSPTSSAIATVSGTPYVVFTGVGANTLYVSRLTSSGWTLVGNPSFPSAPYTANDFVHDSPSPSITSLGGNPYIAFQEWNEPAHINQIRVRTFNGTDRVDVGGASLNASIADVAQSPSITNVGGTLYVAWREGVGGTNQIFVKSFNGSSWVNVGTQPLNVDSTHPADNPFIIGVGGVPYVAWDESNTTSGSGTHLIYVERYAAGAWSQPAAGALNTSMSVSGFGPTIADVGGVPWVSWRETPTVNGNAVFVEQLTGAGWTMVGSGVANPDTSNAASAAIAAVGGRAYLALGQSNGTISTSSVLGFNGSSWVTVGSGLNLNVGNNSSSARLVDVGGVPYVAWLEGSPSVHCFFGDATGCQTYVKRLEPSLGSEIAVPSLTGATLGVQVNDFGVPLPVGFDYGPGSSLASQTALNTTSGTGLSTFTEQIGSLAPASPYSYRAFSSDGTTRLAQGATQSFMTLSPVSPPGGPNGTFSAVGGAKVNAKTGAISFSETVSNPGTLTWTLTFQNGKFGVYAASKTKCKTGQVKLGGKCRPSSVVFGSGRMAVAAAGTVSFTVNPSAAATEALKQALKHKQSLKVTVVLSFQSSLGGSPDTHTVLVTDRLAPKHKHKK